VAGPLKTPGAAARRAAEIGATGAVVSRLALGGGPLGNLLRQVSDEDAERLVLAAHDAGICLFDTAPVYGMGLAERRLGRALRSIDRDDVTVSTKVGRLLRADAPREEELFQDGVPFFRDAPDLGTVWDFSYEGARKSLEESLDRLGLERADIVYLHEPSLERAEWAAADAWRALRDLRAAGSVRAIGLGSDLIEVMIPIVRERELDCLLLASRYSLLDHSALDELLPLCVERGVAVVMGGVFNSGILADPDGTPTFDYVPADVDTRARVARLRGVCDSWGVPLKAAALQFPLLHPAAISVVVGMRTEDELRDNVEMLDVDIPPGLWQDLKDQGLIPEAAPTAARE
jgi:D-threo-aldose 1-dehydrogenase